MELVVLDRRLEQVGEEAVLEVLELVEVKTGCYPNYKTPAGRRLAETGLDIAERRVVVTPRCSQGVLCVGDDGVGQVRFLDGLKLSCQGSTCKQE